MSKQFFLFLFTGGLAALINLSSRCIYNYWFSFSASIILAYITGMITAFVLAKNLVFYHSKQALSHSAIFFVLVNIVAILQTWLISMGLFYYIFPFIGFNSLNKEIAHTIGVMIPVFTSYFGHKYFSFRTES